MISLILPYWDRQVAADKALQLLDEHYSGLDMEVIVVDDGNRIPYVMPETRLDVRVLRRPLKDIPMSPLAAWNDGVQEARGNIIVLSCVEILHTAPVLEQMLENLHRTGEMGYIVASAWCPDIDEFQCHSAKKIPRNPIGTGINFCGMMYKSLYEKIGGFSDEYMAGAGYEDNDFINKAILAGARFVMRDDLVLTHPKEGARIDWGIERLERNRVLYYETWPTEVGSSSVTFACVNAGNYLGRGNEYVSNLYSMLKNCLPEGLGFRFQCFTDDPGAEEGITYRPLPVDGLIGWSNKIALFKKDVFNDGERVIYFDLDTLLMGRIDAMIGYQGEFAILHDFYYPDALGPAVMSWRGGEMSFIWDKYENCGTPELDGGDKEWLELVFKEESYTPNYWQDMCPEMFVSFKKDCAPVPPSGAKVVCFHGVPRIHEISDWVADIWSGEMTSSEMELLCNVELAKIVDNIHKNIKRGVPKLEVMDANNLEILLVGGGPSMKRRVDEIAKRASNGARIMAMNGTSDFLADRGIHVDMHVAIDARESNVQFVQKHSAKQYYFASQCSPLMFDTIKDATLFHIALRDWDKYLPENVEAMAIGGGHSVGMYAMSLAYVLGFRKMHLYGYDSSYEDKQHHAYPQPKNDSDEIIEAHVNGRTFKTTAWMVVQVNEFKNLASQLSGMGCEVITHGEGLLPYVAFQMATLAKAA
jgi:uncharacterized Rossmann fold enzyme